MAVVVECIEAHLLGKLQIIKARLKDKSYKIYESYDEYTNINEIESTTVALRIERIDIEKDS